jgi:hydrogenase small subunit
MSNQTGTPKPTIEQHLTACGVSRRNFLQLCTALMVTAPVGMALTEKKNVLQIAEAIGKAKRPSVIWLHFQDCTGCTETLLRTSHPDVADLILNVISLDYHETLMAASGYQAEATLCSAMEDNAGKYVLVVEGSIPAKDDGVYMELAVPPSRCSGKSPTSPPQSSPWAPAPRGAASLRPIPIPPERLAWTQSFPASRS